MVTLDRGDWRVRCSETRTASTGVSSHANGVMYAGRRRRLSVDGANAPGRESSMVNAWKPSGSRVTSRSRLLDTSVVRVYI
jgi:hypothetical protein